jgi:hypothetical protein
LQVNTDGGSIPIDYGMFLTQNTHSLEPGENLYVKNTGTSGALVTVKGTNWVGTGSAGTVMDVGTTHFGTPQLFKVPQYANKTALASTAQDLLPRDPFLGSRTPINPGVTWDTYWQVSFVLKAGVTYAGTASQTITLESTCQ